MSTIFSKEKQIIFFHIPKTGGITISDSIMKHDPSFFPIDASSYDYRIFDGTVKIHESYLRLLYPNTNIKDYIKIAVIRNPFDKLVSSYRMMCSNIPFDAFLNHILLQTMPSGFYDHPVLQRSAYQDFIWHSYISQYDHCINNNNEFAIDHIIKYENLKTEFKEIIDKYELSELILENFYNSEYECKYRHYYNDSMLDKIYQLFKKDFNYFGY